MGSPPLQRILYAEDEPDVQAVARLALERLGGFTLRVCDNGRQAVEAAAEFAPDLILLDVMMPQMDGPAALQALRARAETAAIPVVFITAKAQPHETAALRALGAVDVIQKPFDPMALPETVRAIWRRHRG